MDFDQTQLFSAIIDARRNRNPEAHTGFVLRYLCTCDDNVVYAPQGLSKLVRDIVDVSRPTSFRIISALSERLHFHKFDEYSLQLNSQFNMKSPQKQKYDGKLMFFNDEESTYLRELREIRDSLWSIRGKDEQPKKHTKRENNMQKLIDSLAKQLDVKDQQLSVKDQQIADLTKLINRIAGGETVSQAEARLKLATVIPLKGGK